MGFVLSSVFVSPLVSAAEHWLISFVIKNLTPRRSDEVNYVRPSDKLKILHRVIISSISGQDWMWAILVHSF